MTVSRRKEQNDRYVLPPLEDLISPVYLDALIEEAKNDEHLMELLVRFSDDNDREVMQQEGLVYIEDHMRFQATTENSVYIAVYAPRGTGKNEVATSMAIDIIRIFKEEDDIKLHLKFARKPSEANELFAEEMAKGRTVCMVLDERETEFGPDSQKEFMALVQLADTMREQRHCLMMCAITRGELGKLLSRCELILRPIFCDRINRINWCILYGTDLHGRTIVAKKIVGIELHPYEWLRKKYKESKHERQFEITTQGGRSGVDSKRVERMTVELARYMEDHGLDTKVKTLKDVLLTEISGGRMLGVEEREAIVNKAYRELSGSAPSSGGRRNEDITIAWVGDRFEWKENLYISLKEGEGSRKFRKEYADIWYAGEIEGLSFYKDQDKVKELIGMSYQVAMKWKRRMDSDDEFQGWVAYYRGEILFESYLAQRLHSIGWNVIRKPKVEIDGEEYEEDLMIESDGEEIYINLKCGQGYRRYVNTEYLTTYNIATELGKIAYIVYFDYVTEVFAVFEASQQVINVGSKKTRSLDWIKSNKLYKSYSRKGKNKKVPTLQKIISTPFLLSAVLNSLIAPSTEQTE